MIIKQSQNKSALSTLEYMVAPADARIVDTNLLGSSPQDWVLECQLDSQKKPLLKKVHKHVKFSFPYRDDSHPLGAYREEVSDDKCAEIAKYWMEGMEHYDCKYLLVAHEEKDHFHLHLFVMRIREDGSVVSDSNDYQRSEDKAREIELEFGLEQQKGSKHKKRTAATTEEYLYFERTGIASTRMKLQALIESEAVGSSSLQELIERLAAKDVEVRLRLEDDGAISGISYKLDGIPFSGKKLGPIYQLAGLQKELGIYDCTREDEASRNEGIIATPGESISEQFGKRIESLVAAVVEVCRAAEPDSSRASVAAAANRAVGQGDGEFAPAGARGGGTRARAAGVGKAIGSRGDGVEERKSQVDWGVGRASQLAGELDEGIDTELERLRWRQKEASNSVRELEECRRRQEQQLDSKPSQFYAKPSVERVRGPSSAQKELEL